jgi:hypothetical protein
MSMGLMGQSPLPERDAASPYIDSYGQPLDRYREM